MRIPIKKFVHIGVLKTITNLFNAVVGVLVDCETDAFYCTKNMLCILLDSWIAQMKEHFFHGTLVGIQSLPFSRIPFILSSKPQNSANVWGEKK
jgi:hypothetical protein